MKKRKFNMKALTYLVMVDGRENAAFAAYVPARDYAKTIRIKRPWEDTLMDVSIVSAEDQNRILYNAINGEILYS